MFRYSYCGWKRARERVHFKMKASYRDFWYFSEVLCIPKKKPWFTTALGDSRNSFRRSLAESTSQNSHLAEMPVQN